MIGLLITVINSMSMIAIWHHKHDVMHWIQAVNESCEVGSKGYKNVQAYREWWNEMELIDPSALRESFFPKGYTSMFIYRAPTPKEPRRPQITGPKPHQYKPPTPKLQSPDHHTWEKNIKNNHEKKMLVLWFVVNWKECSQHLTLK